MQLESYCLKVASVSGFQLCQVSLSSSTSSAAILDAPHSALSCPAVAGVPLLQVVSASQGSRVWWVKPRESGEAPREGQRDGVHSTDIVGRQPLSGTCPENGC
jgi:hypothetical protein